MGDGPRGIWVWPDDVEDGYMAACPIGETPGKKENAGAYGEKGRVAYVREDIVPKIKPLVFVKVSDMGWLAEAPLFGRIHIEKRGKTWESIWSCPGYSDTFAEGEFDTADAAKVATQLEYHKLISNAFCGA